MDGARKTPGLSTRVRLPALRTFEPSPVRALPPPSASFFRARPWYDPPRSVSPIMCVSRHASEGDAPALPLRLGPPHRTGRGRQPTPAKNEGGAGRRPLRFGVVARRPCRDPRAGLRPHPHHGFGTHGDGGHFTEEPDTMLMFCPPISSPLTSPGLSAMFRCSAISVPSTLDLQHPVPPPPPVTAAGPRLPRMLWSTSLGWTPLAMIRDPPFSTNAPVTLKMKLSPAPPLSVTVAPLRMTLSTHTTVGAEPPPVALIVVELLMLVRFTVHGSPAALADAAVAALISALRS